MQFIRDWWLKFWTKEPESSDPYWAEWDDLTQELR